MNNKSKLLNDFIIVKILLCQKECILVVVDRYHNKPER